MLANAVVATGPRTVEYLKVNVPDPGPEHVVIRVTASWISNGTEGSFVRGERIAGDTPRADTDPMPFPHVPGYQKVGVVESVGSAVNEFTPGDVVFATVADVDGMFYPFAGHVSPAVTHVSQVWRLPQGLDPVAASGLVLTQVGYNVGIRPALGPGDAAVVIGDGMVGHWAAQTMQYRGANVMMLGRHDERLARLKCGPGDRVVNVTRQDPLEAVRGWRPDGVRAVASTSGSVADIEALYPVMRHEAHISSAGFYGHEGKIDIQMMRARELTLHSPSGWSRPRMDATLSLLVRGSLSTLPLVTHRFPVSRASEAFRLILSRPEPVLGVILDWE
jgi:2-desacetyl-2-hydroxyethyl bacteriochlorophyllide A dehydrogenase